ncbi:ABC transporter permease [Chitinophaga rhizophila]|uniref:ABC transporter permease n=1 Tax=Chitinophaga rhizophila TaxID=2866212 RepID=A0ABS7G7E4_9BACT|nr:ABC transporter permease [Chitinophaga rhizophila]MBW8683583.1 ABC transporter permease [Chitinophaga rhizophila]
MIKNYIKIALRNLAHNKVYSVINIAGLTIGLTCAMLILLYVQDEASFDRFHPNSNNIYRVVYQSFNHGEEQNLASSGLLQGPRFRQHVPGIKSFVRVQDGYADFKTGSTIDGRSLLFVDSNFLSFFHFPIIDGNVASCLKDRHSVVITRNEAIKRFGTADAVGKVLMVREGEDFAPYQVTAVTENCPQNSSIQYNILMPIREKPDDQKNDENWFSYYLSTFIELEEHADPTVVRSQMQRFYEQDATATFYALNAKFGNTSKDVRIGNYLLQPLLDIHMSTTFAAQNGLDRASNPIYAYILSGIALFVLLIASINFVNLTVARSVRRAKEIGIRKAVGSDRRQLIVQFLGESFVLCAIAFLFAILLVQLLLPVFNELANKKLAIGYLIGGKLISAYILLFLLTGLMAGCYPALILSGYRPVDTLYGRFTLKGKGILQKSLVILQFTLASFLIIATFTIYSQFNYMVKADLGYNDQDIVMVSRNNITHQEAALFKEQLLRLPDIQYVAPKNGGAWSTMANMANDSSIRFAWETIDESYLETLQIALVQGRNFSADHPGDSVHSVLVNETFVKQAGWKDPIGQPVVFNFQNNKRYEVIGVIKDHHYASLDTKIQPQLFTMSNANPYGVFYIKIRPNTATRSLAYIEQQFKKFFPLTPYQYVFKNEANLKSYESEARWKRIILFGAVLTIFISCIGLFGLSVLSAEKRNKEIGIRKVLGASVQSIAALLSFDFIRLVLIALVVAMPLAWLAIGKWLENYPYRITPGWTIFGYAGGAVLLIAAVTVSYQAVKVALGDPVKSLRSE